MRVELLVAPTTLRAAFAAAVVVFAAPAVPAAGGARASDAVVIQPRPFGYVIGDLIEQRVLLPDEVTLPKPGRSNPLQPGRVGAWLERRNPTVAKDAEGRRWLVVDYQLINAPQGLTTINLPAWQLAGGAEGRGGGSDGVSGVAGGGSSVLTVPAWPITIEALTARTVLAQGGLQELRPDRPAPVIPTRPIVRQLALWSGAFVATLLAWLVWILWRNWRAATGQPFATAAREMRNESDSSPAAWQALHRAFDRTAGRVVQVASLPGLFVTTPQLEPLRPQIEQFFAQSAQWFFAGGLPEQLVSVHELCDRLRRVERVHER